MTVPTKLASFALALALVFGGGYAAGSAVGPFDGDRDTPRPMHDDSHEFGEDQ